MRSAPWFLVTVLALVGCWSSKDSALFTDAAPVSGTGGGGADGGVVAGTAGTAPSGGTGGTGGTGAASGTAGDETGAPVAGTGAKAGSSTGGQPHEQPIVTDCSMVMGAVVNETNGHCYRVAFENFTFAQARDACEKAGGHLATIASADENEFVRALHDGEHWIGASDGRDDLTPGVGTYQWVTAEPWTFSDWEEGQPNAFETDCPDNGDADCFEHCAFQTGGGNWKDRSCWHTIVSICEWDIDAPVDEPGAGGATGAGGSEGGPFDPTE